MNAENLKQSKERARSIQRRYESNFAGHPRISRNLNLLESLIEESRALLEAWPEGEEELRTETEQNLALYTREIESIRQAQAQGTDAFDAHVLNVWAQLNFARYRRNFAGKSRATRDLGLLEEMLKTLSDLEAQMAPLLNDNPIELKESHKSCGEYINLLQRERSAIGQLRIRGTLEEQADLLAQVANNQFKLYRDQFSGRARLSRRPALLQRMIQRLEEILERMHALRAQGHHRETHARNIDLVSSRLSAWREELKSIQNLRSELSFSQLVSALAEGANALFEEYRVQFAGQPRESRDLEKLNSICEGLYDLAWQMDELERVRADQSNQDNLQIIFDHLRIYDREFERIQSLQKGD